MKKLFTLFTFLLFSIAVHAQAWAVAGGFNGWNNALDGLYDDGTHGDVTAGDNIVTGQVTVATAGRYEWKAVLWGNWSTAYPADNSWIYTTVPNQVVTFTFNTNTYTDNWFPLTNIVNANDNPGPVVAAGTHQGWNNAGTEVMHDDGLDGDLAAGDGIYTWHAILAAPGNYGWKPVYSGTWDAWGSDNRKMYSADQNYTTTDPNQNVYFYLNNNTGRIAVSAQPALRLNLTVLIQGYLNLSNSKITPDTVSVELHNSVSPYALIDSKQVLLDSSGNGTLYFNHPNDVPYWLVVKFRNCVETWSWAAVTFTGSVLNYDFTWTQGAAYGNNLALAGDKWCLFSGDVNQDGFITGDDFAGVDNDASNFDYHAVNDVNGDGFVTGDDFMFIDNNAALFVERIVP
jgi:hypothetical protein